MKILPSFLVTTFLLGAATLASAKPVRSADEDNPTPRERAAERFDRIDADNDGVISRAEFMAHHKERMDKIKDHDGQKGQKGAKGAKGAKGQKGQKGQKAKTARRAKRTKSV